MIINPSAAVAAVQAPGAKLKNGKVNGTQMPKVDGTAWVLVTGGSGACLMSTFVFRMLQTCTLHLDGDGNIDGTVDVPPSSFTTGGNFMLTPLGGYAELRDPVP